MTELAKKNEQLLLEIAERKRIEEALRESEIKYRTLVEHIPAITYIAALDETSTTLYISPRQIEQILGFAPSEWQEEGYDIWFRQLHPDDRARVIAEVTAGHTSRNPFAMEYRMLTHAGEVVWIRDEAMVATDEAGHPLFQHGVMFDITERKRAEEALRVSEEKFSKAFHASPTLIGISTLKDGCYIDVNESFTRITGYSRAEAIGRTSTELNIFANLEDRDKLAKMLREQGSLHNVEASIRVKSGEVRIGLFSAELIDIRGEQCLLAVVDDITERRRLEAQLHQAQKMEAIGRLAGGVSHDFNNLLTSIMGYTELALLALHPGDPIRSDLEGIQKTAERAANLTRQLLAFARKQVINPTVLNLNDLILNVDKMLRRLIGEDIELVTLPAPDLGQVKADPGQLEQVLLNLAVNARDAMPTGGKLTIETANIVLGEDYAHQHPEVTPGEYTMLTISDTGTGMTEEVKSRIFEPFFTTKEKSKGTGLGLATCFGIVKQNDGHIWVDSELDRGTTFKICLPRVRKAVSPTIPQEKSGDLPRGTETVLLVEDEPAVRDLAKRVLRGQGFKVLDAANGEEALRVVREHAGARIELLLTDVVMPRMGGRELADRLKATYPELKILFTSGYTDKANTHFGTLEPGMAFLQKPFTPEALIHQVREILDRGTIEETNS